MNSYAANEEARRSGFGTKDVRLVLGAGVLYLLMVFWREYIFYWIFGFPSAVSVSRFPELVVTYQFASAALVLPALGIILVPLLRPTARPLKAALKMERFSLAFAIAISTVLLSLLLNNTDLWPFTWRPPDNAAAAHVAALFLHGHWLAIVVLTVRLVVLTPLIEEAIFRFGLLQGVYGYTGSRHAAILISSLAFGIAHLGYWPFWQASKTILANAFWLFVFSLVLGDITLRREGRITAAIVAHGARNAVELATLLYAISITAT